MITNSITPQFGVNYQPGYIGFTFTRDSEISKGIAYFERWERLSDIKVSHVLIVSGANECIEAHAGEGVARAPLDKYFNDPHTLIFFRQPKRWAPELGQRIVDAAAAKIGCKYNFELIAADMMADSLFGHWCNQIFHNYPRRFVARLLDQTNEFICSQLGSYSMAVQPEFKGVGCLEFPLDTIEPQELFEDEQLFEGWTNKSGHGPEELHKL